jgi:hypothetical protein
MRRKAKIIPFPRRDAPGGPPTEPVAPPTGPALADERGLVEVHRSAHPEAMVVKGLLESEGIPTLSRSRITHSVHPFSIGAQGEVVLLVPHTDVARARRLLARVAPPREAPGRGRA